jgi:hypothetical protein
MLAYILGMRRVWIVLFLIALLPVRGWAVASMTADAGGAHHAHGSAATVPAVLPPCHGDLASADAAGDPAPHGHAAGPQPTTEADADADRSHAGHLCAVCDLCHAPAAPAATGPTLGLHAPTPVRCATVQRDTGRVLAGALDRPPRT